MNSVKKNRSELIVAPVENVGSSTTTNLPRSLACGFTNNPTRLLPEEVLELVFENIHHPEDFNNVINSCPQFRRILKPRRTADLFGMVLPLISTQLRTKELLKCRLVCKSWRFGVRLLLHDHPSVRPYDPKNDNVRNPASNVHTQVTKHFGGLLKPIILGTNLQQRLSTDRVHREMRNYSGNPFVYEMVVATATTFDMSSQTWQQTFKFLKSHGRYITHYKMRWQDYDNCFVQFYKIMQHCLKLLPNLTTLEFGYSNVGDENMTSMLVAHDRHEDDDKSILQIIIDKHDLPPMPKLDTLIMIILEPFKSRYQRMILESLLLKYEGQLKKIHVSPVLWIARFAQLEDLGNSLTELHVETRRSKPALILKLLWTFKKYWNLRKLSFSIDWQTKGINFYSFMKAIAGIKSVRYLKFDYPSVDVIDPLNKMIEIRNVRTLEIVSEYDKFVCDTIIGCFPALEYLKVEKASPIELGMEGTKRGKLYESRIWDKLPCLKEIILCTKTSDPKKFLRLTRDRFESLIGK